MIESLTLLLICQLLGEALVTGLHWPVPGPVLGMAILFIGLLIRGGVPEPLARTAGGLLEHLSLLFVPAGVGVMLHLGLLEQEWLPVSLSLVISTLLTLLVTGLIMQRLGRRGEDAHE